MLGSTMSTVCPVTPVIPFDGWKEILPYKTHMHCCPCLDLIPRLELFFVSLVYGKHVEHVPCMLQIIRNRQIDWN